MKKCLMILVIVLGFITVKINANNNNKNEVLICEVDVGSDEDLLLDNCVVVNSKVNWNLIGDYEVTYFDKIKEVYFNRLVRIVNNFDQELDLYLDKVYSVNDDYYLVKDYLEIDKGDFFIAGSIDYDEEQIQMEFVQEYAFIRYYENNTLIWEKIFDEYSYIVRLEKGNQGIICFMAFFNGEESDIKLLEINKSGRILREKVISGNNYEYAEDMMLINNQLYLVVASYSTSGDIKTNFPEHRFIGIVIVDYFSFEIEKQIALGNSGYNLYHDMEYNYRYNKLSIIIYTEGNMGSLITRDGNRKGNFLICLDQDLTIEKYYYLGISGENYFFYASDEKLIVFYSNNKYVYADVYTNDFSLIKSYNYGSILNDYSLVPKKVRQKQGKKNLIMINKREGGILTFSGFLYFNKGVDYYPYEGECFGSYFSCINADNSLYIIGGNDTNIINIKEYIQVKTILFNTYTYNYETYQSRTFLINNREEFLLGTVRKKDVFGRYQDKYIYNSPFITIVTNDKYYVKPEININNNEIYDVNLKLKFNGEGYLNDEAINTNHVITDEGIYTLIVVGNDDRKVLNFTVKNLTVSGEAVQFDELEIEDIKVSSNIPNQEILVTETNFITISNTSAIVFAVIIASVLIGLSIIIPIKRRKL